MPQVQFAAPSRQAKLMLVLAVWHELMTEWGDATDPFGAPMLRRHSKSSLSAYLNSGSRRRGAREQAARACGFDIVLRLASGQIDTMHATDAFFTRADNGNWFVPVDIVVSGTGKPLRGVRLTPEAIAIWHDSLETERNHALGEARRRLESDLESKDGPVQLLPLQESSPVRSSALPVTTSRKSCLEALVRMMHVDAFQPMYRKRPCGAPVTGWDARLQAYFWPAPHATYRDTCLNLQALERAAHELAEALLREGTWNPAQGQRAVDLAHAIFTWGGVPQDEKTVTPATVEQVFKAALANDKAARAHMNSGWTKVAAFATAHLEQDSAGQPQAIWDSRVATAIISRLDALLAEGVAPASLFPGVGTVPGQGGTRPRAMTRRWPSGYQRWSGQVAGSEVVREIRDILNLNPGDYPAMPLPEGGTGPWTTRGVEMVLFMDGY